MTDPTNGRADHIRELREQRDKLLDQAEQLRLQINTEIGAAFPLDGEPPRGTLTALVNATGWTRAHVANIRDAELAIRRVSDSAQRDTLRTIADHLNETEKD